MEISLESSLKSHSYSLIAPKPPSLPSSPAALSPAILKPKSCLVCRQRKVKCDRHVPCANCIRWSINCVFPSPVRRCPRPHRKPHTRPSGDESLHQRIRVLESRILELTETVNIQADRIQSLASPSITLFPTSHGWTQAVSPLHPSLSVAQLFWRVFHESVDPLIKVVHRPTVDQIFRRVMINLTSLTEGQEALLLAIYLACISAMGAIEVQARLQMSKATAISTFRTATEQALIRAHFITTDDWTTIQALVLFTSGSRFQDKQNSAWTLAGLAQRLDSSIREGSPPFEKEMRRRLWWHLWYLDHRRREDRGRDAGAIKQPDTTSMALEPPLNCCDSELHCDMTAPAAIYSGWTEMSFCLLQYDLATTRQTLESDTPWPDRVRILRDCEDRIQSKYLTYCDGTQPIHWLACHVSHVMITEMWMNLLGPRIAFLPIPDPEQEIRDQLFWKAIDILDIQKRLDSEPLAKHWEWLLGAYFQYVPLSFLLDELCWRRDECVVSLAWGVAERAFQRWTEDARKSDHGVALTELMSRALSARQEAIRLDSTENYCLVADRQSALGDLNPHSIYDGEAISDELQMGTTPSYMDFVENDVSTFSF